MDSQEFAEWKVIYGNIETFGEPREDLRMGILASTIANYAGKVMNEGKSTTPADFMPFQPPEEKPKQSETDQLAAVEMIVTALGVSNRDKA